MTILLSAFLLSFFFPKTLYLLAFFGMVETWVVVALNVDINN